MTRKFLAVAALAVLSSLSFAQGFRPNARMMRAFQTEPVQQLTMIRREDVQEEIKMSDDQKGKLDALNAGAQDRFRSAFQDMRNGGGGDGDRETMMKAMQERMQTLFETLSKEAMAILDEGQQKRIKELVVQAQGSLAVLLPNVAKQVELTSAQKTKIAELQNLQDEATNGLFEKVQTGEVERTEVGALMQKNTKIMDDSVAKLLTEGQRAKLKALSGKPFEFKDPKPGTPGAFGRPGGGGR